jgi:hypothetical protein
MVREQASGEMTDAFTGSGQKGHARNFCHANPTLKTRVFALASVPSSRGEKSRREEKRRRRCNVFKKCEVNQMNIGLLIHHSSLIKAVHMLIEQMGHRAFPISQDPEIPEHLLDGSTPTEIDLLLMESDVFSLPSDIQLIHELSSGSPSVPLLLLVNADRQKGIQEAFLICHCSSNRFASQNCKRHSNGSRRASKSPSV